MQLVAEKAVPLTETLTEDHLKPFVKDHAQEIKAGIQQLTDQGIIPGAEQLQDELPEAAEKFTEETLKPAAAKLSKDIEDQVPPFSLADAKFEQTFFPWTLFSIL